MIINMNGAKAPETPSPTLQEKTVTPETLPTVIGADEGYDGLSQVTVNPDSQLIPTNIRSGKTVFGVEGSFVGESAGGLDLAKVGLGRSLSMEATIYGYPPVIEENPTRLTELDMSSVKYYEVNDTSSTYIMYDNGCIAAKQTDSLTPRTTTYIPSLSNYDYYFKSGTIPGGPMKFYFAEYLSRYVSNATNIRGEGYLMPVLQLATSELYQTAVVFREADLRVAGTDEIAQPIKITIDAPLVDADIEGQVYYIKMFTLDVPEITFSSYAYTYTNHKIVGIGLSYMFIPYKVVIS